MMEPRRQTLTKIPSRTHLRNPSIGGGGFEDNDFVNLQIEIEDYAELLAVNAFPIKLSRDLTVSEALRKIANKGSVSIIASNYAYGESNFDLVFINQQKAEEIVLPKGSKLRELPLRDKSHIVLRKKTQEQVRLWVQIDDYQQLNCARQMMVSFYQDQSVQEALHKIARRGAVSIPVNEENDYGLYYQGELMEYTKKLSTYSLTHRDTIVLRKKKDEEIAVIVLIEDYKQLNSARKTSALLRRDETVNASLHKIAKKATVNIPDGDVDKFNLYLLSAGEYLYPGIHLEKSAKLEKYKIRSRDSLVLRNDGEAAIPSAPIPTDAAKSSAGSAPSSADNNNNNNNSSTDVKIQYHELELVEKLGQGQFGKVYRGKYKESEVAIKILKDLLEETQRQEFRSEASMMRQLEFPYLVKYFGFVEEPQKMAIVMEFCPRGSLYHVLNSELYEIGWDRILKFATEMTKAVQYLHNHDPPILHRDIKTLNLLVTDEWDIKLCDFGLSRFKNEKEKDTLRKLRTTAAWSAPELLLEVGYSTKSDIFSVGMVLWELVHRCVKGKYQRPFAEFKEIVFDYQIIVQAAKKDKRPTMPPTTPIPMADLIRQCWDGNPDVRPTSDELLAKFEVLQKDYDQDPHQWDKTKDEKEGVSLSQST